MDQCAILPEFLEFFCLSFDSKVSSLYCLLKSMWVTFKIFPRMDFILLAISSGWPSRFGHHESCHRDGNLKDKSIWETIWGQFWRATLIDAQEMATIIIGQEMPFHWPFLVSRLKAIDYNLEKHKRKATSKPITDVLWSDLPRSPSSP